MAMSWGVCERSSQVASRWPSSATTCSVSRNPSASLKNLVLSSTSSAVTKMWSSRGGAIPTSPSGRGGGLVRGSRLPTFSMPQTSSQRCPLGVWKRIASPCPGASSPRACRVTWPPCFSTARS